MLRIGRDRDFEALGIAPVDFDPRPGSDGRDAADAYGTDAGTRGTFGCQGELLGTETEDGSSGRRRRLGGKVDQVSRPFGGRATPDRRVSREIREPWRAGVAIEVEGASRLQEAAAFDRGDVVGSRNQVSRVVRDVEEGEVEVALEIAEESAQVSAEGGIEVGEGFVEEEEVGLEDQGTTDGRACGLAARKRGGEMMESWAEIKPVPHDLGSGAPLVSVEALEAEGKLELLDEGQVGKESGGLGDPAAGAILGRETGDVGVVEEDAAGIRGFESGDEAEGGGLAAAGRSHQEVMRAGSDVDGKVLDCRDLAETFADSLKADAGHVTGRFKFSDSSVKLRVVGHDRNQPLEVGYS